MFLTAAARYLKSRGHGDDSRVRFVIVGDGNLRRELEEQAQRLSLGDQVIFLGSRNDPENFYPALDVVALTSHNEGTPLTLIEAMANSCPVIATEVGGVCDLLGSRVTEGSGFVQCERGLAVRPGDSEGFASGVAALINDPELRRNLGERGRLFVTENYSKERLINDLSNLYQKLLGQRQKSAVLEHGVKGASA
jgi:glycosyltransferase involved in cell wall biosynthesis